jgi:hypothetical protein
VEVLVAVRLVGLELAEQEILQAHLQAKVIMAVALPITKVVVVVVVVQRLLEVL